MFDAASEESRRALRKRRTINYAEGGSRTRTHEPTLRARAPKERMRTGMLSGLMHVPVDIFLEIASRLQPLDLLHIARISKQLRSVVLSRKSITVWKASLRDADGLPSCPDDMSELLDQLCGMSPVRWVDYAIRLRLGRSCHRTHIRRGRDVIAEAPESVSYERARVAVAMVPCEVGKHLLDAPFQENPCVHAPGWNYYAPQLKAALSMPVRARREGESLDDYLNDLGADSRRLHQRAQKANEDLKASRKAIIVEKLTSLGYEESDMPDNPAWSTLVEQTKALTERIWTNLLPKLEVLLQEEKERKTRVTHDERVERQLQQLSGYYTEWAEAFPEEERRLMPNAHDGARLPCLLALAQADDAQRDLSLQDFLPLADQVLDDAKAYLAHARQTAVTMLQDAIFKMPDYDVWHTELESLSTDDALCRHYALFECEERSDVCNTDMVTFEGLHAHWRTAHARTAWGTAGPPELHLAPVNPAKLVTRIKCRGSYRVGGEMLDAVGLPRESPRNVLDGLIKSGRLYCACGDPSLPPPEELDWIKLYAHVASCVERHQRRTHRIPKASKKIALKSDHGLTGPHACMKLLPGGADTAPAYARVAIDSETRAQVEARLASRPRPEAVALCRSCRTLTARSQLKYGSVIRELMLPQTPDGIAYHLRGWHEKEFEERDDVWDTRGIVI